MADSEKGQHPERYCRSAGQTHNFAQAARVALPHRHGHKAVLEEEVVHFQRCHFDLAELE
jgi:hypothetical protein